MKIIQEEIDRLYDYIQAYGFRLRYCDKNVFGKYTFGKAIFYSGAFIQLVNFREDGEDGEDGEEENIVNKCILVNYNYREPSSYFIFSKESLEYFNSNLHINDLDRCCQVFKMDNKKSKRIKLIKIIKR